MFNLYLEGELLNKIPKMSGAESHLHDKNSDQKLETFLFTSESVGEGHPGILCVQDY